MNTLHAVLAADATHEMEMNLSYGNIQSMSGNTVRTYQNPSYSQVILKANTDVDTPMCVF